MNTKKKRTPIYSLESKTQPFSCIARNLLTSSMRSRHHTHQKQKKDICFSLNLSVKSFSHTQYNSHTIQCVRWKSGMAVETLTLAQHAHFQFSQKAERTTARQHTSHEPCECVHPLANTRNIMTITSTVHTIADSQSLSLAHSAIHFYEPRFSTLYP